MEKKYKYFSTDRLSSILTSLVIDVHSVLSKALALNFIPKFLKSHSTSSNQINIGLSSFPHLLVYPLVASLLPFYNPFLHHAQGIPMYLL